MGKGEKKDYSIKDSSWIKKGGLNRPPENPRPSNPPAGQQKPSGEKNSSK